MITIHPADFYLSSLWPAFLAADNALNGNCNDRNRERFEGICEAIIDAPASTLAGVRVKLKLALDWADPYEVHQITGALESALADLDRLEGAS